MYYIYVDEAGTSKHEPVTVVAAVLIDADKHWAKASKEVNSLADLYVPAKLGTGSASTRRTFSPTVPMIHFGIGRTG